MLSDFVKFARRNKYFSGMQLMNMFGRANPKKTIAFVGLFAAIISCYPVVFCGMRIESPALNPTCPLFGWEIQFVLSKILFAVGMGLLVFLFTNNFLAGSLIAFSSCFLGFFAYRINHPDFFGLSYAPWIVIIWNQIGWSLNQPHPNIKKCLIHGLLLAAITWLQLHAGAPVEGVVTACFMHALGMFVFMDRVRNRLGLLRSLLLTMGFGVALVMISSSFWLLFVDVLNKSYTNSYIPQVQTFSLWKLIGVFENFFFQQIDGSPGGPSSNIFILLGVTGAIVCMRWYKSIITNVTAILFFLALAIAFGVIPTAVLVSIPLVKNMIQVNTTFLEPLMILGLILSGFGIKNYIIASKKQKITILILAFFLFAGLCMLYLSAIIYLQLNVAYSGKAIWLIFPFFAVVATALWQLYRQSESGRWTNRILIILAVCFLLLHVRHGMHFMTGNKSVDLFLTSGPGIVVPREICSPENYTPKPDRALILPAFGMMLLLMLSALFPGLNYLKNRNQKMNNHLVKEGNLTLNKKENMLRLKPNLGLGDLLIYLSYIRQHYQDYDKFQIVFDFEKLLYWRNDSQRITDFTKDLVSIWFNDPKIEIVNHLDESDYTDRLELYSNVKHEYLRPAKLSNVLDQPYICIGTKVRLEDYYYYLSYKDKFLDALTILSVKYKIVIMGEREIENNKEIEDIHQLNSGLFLIYNDIINKIDKNNLIDLTREEILHDNNVADFYKDVLIMKNSEFTTFIGGGGFHLIAMSFALKVIGYRSYGSADADNYLSGKLINDENLFLTNDIDVYIEKLKNYKNT